MPILLEAKNVTKVYAKAQHPSLNKVSLSVMAGEFLAIMGDCEIIGLNRKNLTNTGVLRHSPISLTRKGWLKNCHIDLIRQRCN